MNRRVSATFVLLTAAVCAACASPAGVPASTPTDAGGTSQPASAPQTAKPEEDLEQLVLTVADLPSGGWVEDPAEGTSGEVSSDKESAGICAMDLTELMEEPADEDEAFASFSRDSLQQRMTVGVIRDADPDSAVATIDGALAECPARLDFVSNGQQASVSMSPYEGTAPADSVCRHFTMTVGYARATGDLCFASAGGYFYGGFTMARYEHQAVEPSEFDQVLTAQAALLR